MKTTTRIATAAAALALLAAPAARAADGASRDGEKQDRAACTCSDRGSSREKAEKKTAQPEAPEYPIFTDQG